MKRIACLLLALVALTSVLVYMAHAAGRSDAEAEPIFGIKIPPGYRDWKLISVAHEEGNLNDLRALLGNDTAIKAYRDGKLPFPDGTIIARLAWSYVPSEENNKAFGRAQSFVAGPVTNVQFMVKDSKKYARQAAGGSLNLKTANLMPRRRSRPASRVTSLPKLATLFSLNTHPDARANTIVIRSANFSLTEAY